MIITKKKTLQKSTDLGLPNDLSNKSLLNGLAALKWILSFHFGWISQNYHVSCFTASTNWGRKSTNW